MFLEVVNLVIKHLSIIYCGYPVMDDREGPSAAVHLIDITSLKVLSISVENNTPYGMMDHLSHTPDLLSIITTV